MLSPYGFSTQNFPDQLWSSLEVVECSNYGHIRVNIYWRLGMSSSSESSHLPQVLAFPVSCGAPALSWLELNRKMGCRSVLPTCQVQIPPQITPNAQSSWVCSTDCPPGHVLCCSGLPHTAVQPTPSGDVWSKQCSNGGLDGIVPATGLKVRSPVGTGWILNAVPRQWHTDAAAL